MSKNKSQKKMDGNPFKVVKPERLTPEQEAAKIKEAQQKAKPK